MKLQTKDLIYAGAFSAIYIIARYIIIMTLGLIPILYIILPLFTGIICATIYMMYVTKVKKKGAILILGTLFGIVMTSTGHFYSVFLCVPIALLAECVAKINDFNSKKMIELSYVIFNLTMVTPFAQIYISKEIFLEETLSYYSESYATTLAKILDFVGDWLIVVQCLSAVVGALIGLVLAGKLFEKHFKKAGVV